MNLQSGDVKRKIIMNISNIYFICIFENKLKVKGFFLCLILAYNKHSSINKSV